MTLNYKILGQLYYGAEVDQEPELPGSGYYISTIGEQKDIFLRFVYFAPIAFHSNDGITWTIVSTGVTGISEAAYSDGKIVAFSGSGNILLNSTDGIIWNTSEFPDPNPSYYYGLVAGDGKFLLFDGGTSNTIYSLDGINWSMSVRPGTQAQFIYADGKFINAENNIVTYTTDGVSWGVSNLPYSISGWGFMQYGNGVFVVSDLDYQSSRVAVSSDLESWNISTTSLTSQLQEFKFLNDKFYRFGSYDWSGYSTDGLTWTLFLMPNSLSDYWSGSFYSNGVYLARAGSSGGYLAYSLDGANWASTQVSSEGHTIDYRFMYGDGKFVVGSYYTIGPDSQSGVYYSLDGINWSPGNSPLTDYVSTTVHGKINTLQEIQTLIGGQGIPGSYVEIIEPQVLYEVPQETETLISSLYITNSDTVARSYDLAVVPNGETLSLKHHIRWDSLVEANLFDNISAKITLSAGDRIYVFPSTIDKIAFTAFGVEKK